MKPKYLLIILLVIILPYSIFAGHEVRNGGDVIKCYSKKMFSLDYIIEKNKNHTLKLFQPKSIEESFARILSVLNRKFPELYPSFSKFSASIFSDSDHVHWIKSSLPLDEIEDENLSLGDKICPQIGFEKRPEFIQAIVRTSIDQKILYYFDQSIIKMLDPLQLSFLLIHEWLWDVSEDVIKNREINFLLHREDY